MKAAKSLTEKFCFRCESRSLFEADERVNCLKCSSNEVQRSKCSNCGMYHMGISSLCRLCLAREEEMSIFELSSGEAELSDDEIKFQYEEIRNEVLDLLQSYLILKTPTPSPALAHLQISPVPSYLHGYSCPVCFETLIFKQESVTLPCQHIYHSVCILRWLQHSDSCPVCRHSIN